MEMANRYQIHTARDDRHNLAEVLEFVATVKGHVRIVSVMWQPSRPGAEGHIIDPGYTVIAEVEG